MLFFSILFCFISLFFVIAAIGAVISFFTNDFNIIDAVFICIMCLLISFGFLQLAHHFSEYTVVKSEIIQVDKSDTLADSTGVTYKIDEHNHHIRSYELNDKFSKGQIAFYTQEMTPKFNLLNKKYKYVKAFDADGKELWADKQ
jgi:hypothetical protein